MKTITLDPKIEELTRLNEFVQNEFDLDNNSISLIIEEVFVNIVYYSKCDYITFDISRKEDCLTMTFKDNGLKFNPLEADEPEPPGSIEEAKIGGLGIYLVKKLADDVSYQYTDDENQLTITMNVKT